MNGITSTLAALIVAAVLFGLGLIHRRNQTARKTISRLQQQNEELAREIASLELLKTSLLSRVGEALSQPLLKVGETAEELREHEDDLTEDVRKSLSALSAEVTSISRILRVFEEMASRNEEGVSTSENPVVEFDEIATLAVQKAVDSAAGQGISLAVSLDSGIRVRSSAEHLEEALDSLVGEALRRASRGSMITMTLTAEENTACLALSYESGIDGTQDSVLGTGMARLIATSFGGWLNEDAARGLLTLSLPLAEGGTN